MSHRLQAEADSPVVAAEAASPVVAAEADSPAVAADASNMLEYRGYFNGEG